MVVTFSTGTAATPFSTTTQGFIEPNLADSSMGLLDRLVVFLTSDLMYSTYFLLVVDGVGKVKKVNN